MQQTRQQRKASARELARGIMHTQPSERISGGDWVLWFLAAAMAIALFLAAPKLGKLATFIGLVLLFACLVKPTAHLPWIRKATPISKKRWKLFGCLIADGILVAAFGWWVLPEELFCYGDVIFYAPIEFNAPPVIPDEATLVIINPTHISIPSVQVQLTDDFPRLLAKDCRNCPPRNYPPVQHQFFPIVYPGVSVTTLHVARYWQTYYVDIMLTDDTFQESISITPSLDPKRLTVTRLRDGKKFMADSPGPLDVFGGWVGFPQQQPNWLSRLLRRVLNLCRKLFVFNVW